MQKELQGSLTFRGKIWSYYLYEIVYISVLLYLAFHFSENPVAVVFFMFIFLILSCFSSYDYVIVDATMFSIQHKRLFNLNLKAKKFELKDIKKINATLNFDLKTDLEANVLNFGSAFVFFSFNKLEFEMKDGTKKHINSEIYKKHFITIFDFIKQHSDIEIEMQ